MSSSAPSVSAEPLIADVLIRTVSVLLADGRGLLAIDERASTCDRRFRALGIPETIEARRAYRELIVTTPDLGASISGMILCDETIRQHTRTGVRFVDVLRDAGMVVGIKVDRGATALAGRPGERVTEGLDGLRRRLGDYRVLGARFAKWRGVIAIDAALPSAVCIAANAQRWLATPRCVRKLAWCRPSNPRC